MLMNELGLTQTITNILRNCEELKVKYIIFFFSKAVRNSDGGDQIIEWFICVRASIEFPEYVSNIYSCLLPNS